MNCNYSFTPKDSKQKKLRALPMLELLFNFMDKFMEKGRKCLEKFKHRHGPQNLLVESFTV